MEEGGWDSEGGAKGTENLAEKKGGLAPSSRMKMEERWQLSLYGFSF